MFRNRLKLPVRCLNVKTTLLYFTILGAQWSLYPDVFDEVRLHGHGWRKWKVCSPPLQGWAEELHQGVSGTLEVEKILIHSGNDPKETKSN